jgi:hypothetical protein
MKISLLPKESKNGRVSPADFMVCLDRERDMVVVTKLKAEDRVTDIPLPPGGEEKSA